MAWVTGTIAAATVGLAMSMAPTSASAITFGGGGTCAGDFATNAGAQTGGGSYSTASGNLCATNGVLANLISGFSGDRGDAANWSVMTGNGASDGSNPYGVFNTTGGHTATFLLHIAANSHEIGWTDDATQTQRNVIVDDSSATTVGTVVEFSTTETFQLYAENTSDFQNGNVFFSERSNNSFNQTDDYVHFAILQYTLESLPVYLVVVEDLVFGCVNDNNTPGDDSDDTRCGTASDALDFNDAGLLLQIPEPATMALFGAGLLGLGLYRRRRA
jgi:hypothetical protein